MSGIFTRRAVAAFNKWAADYADDAMGKLARRGYSYAELAGEVAKLLGVEPGDHVLEIGTGPGILGAEVAVELPGAEIIGIDISAGMAHRAMTQGVYSGVARANFERLPFTTAFFGAVYTGFVFHSLFSTSRQAQALNELRRVLRPGGRAVVVDLFPIGRSLPVAVALGVAHSIVYEGCLARYAPPSEFVRLALDAGFEIEAVKPLGACKTYRHFIVALHRGLDHEESV